MASDALRDPRKEVIRSVEEEAYAKTGAASGAIVNYAGRGMGRSQAQLQERRLAEAIKSYGATSEEVMLAYNYAAEKGITPADALRAIREGGVTADQVKGRRTDLGYKESVPYAPYVENVEYRPKSKPLITPKESRPKDVLRGKLESLTPEELAQRRQILHERGVQAGVIKVKGRATEGASIVPLQMGESASELRGETVEEKAVSKIDKAIEAIKKKEVERQANLIMASKAYDSRREFKTAVKIGFEKFMTEPLDVYIEGKIKPLTSAVRKGIESLAPSEAALADLYKDELKSAKEDLSKATKQLEENIKIREENIKVLEDVMKDETVKKFTTEKSRKIFERDLAEEKAAMKEEQGLLKDYSAELKSIESSLVKGEEFGKVDRILGIPVIDVVKLKKQGVSYLKPYIQQDIELLKGAVREPLVFFGRPTKTATETGTFVKELVTPSTALPTAKGFVKAVKHPIFAGGFISTSALLELTSAAGKGAKVPEYKAIRGAGKGEVFTIESVSEEAGVIRSPSGEIIGTVKGAPKAFEKSKIVYVPIEETILKRPPKEVSNVFEIGGKAIKVAKTGEVAAIEATTKGSARFIIPEVIKEAKTGEVIPFLEKAAESYKKVFEDVKATFKEKPSITLETGEKLFKATGEISERPPLKSISDTVANAYILRTPSGKAKALIIQYSQRGEVLTTVRMLKTGEKAPSVYTVAGRIEGGISEATPTFPKGRPANFKPSIFREQPAKKVPVLENYFLRPYQTKEGIAYKLIEIKPFRAKPSKGKPGLVYELAEPITKPKKEAKPIFKVSEIEMSIVPQIKATAADLGVVAFTLGGEAGARAADIFTGKKRKLPFVAPPEYEETILPPQATKRGAYFGKIEREKVPNIVPVEGVKVKNLIKVKPSQVVMERKKVRPAMQLSVKEAVKSSLKLEQIPKTMQRLTPKVVQITRQRQNLRPRQVTKQSTLQRQRMGLRTKLVTVKVPKIELVSEPEVPRFPFFKKEEKGEEKKGAGRKKKSLFGYENIDVTPLSDLLSLTATETKLGIRAASPRATKRIKVEYGKFRKGFRAFFPTAQQRRRKKRK